MLEYTPHGRVRALGPDGTQLCVEQGTGKDCLVALALPPFGFSSAYRSQHTGVTYMRNRWYDARLGQFLTHDPLGYIDSYNPYAYAGFDPINFWDPFGLGSQQTAGLCTSVFECARSPEADQRIGEVQRRVRELQQRDAAPTLTGPQIQECGMGGCKLTAEQRDNIIKFGIEEVIVGALTGFAGNVGIRSLRITIAGLPSSLKRQLANSLALSGRRALKRTLNLFRRLQAEEWGTVDVDVRRLILRLLRSRVRQIAGFADEGVPIIVDHNLKGQAAALRARGFNAREVEELFGNQSLASTPDSTIQALAQAVGAKILTKDRSGNLLQGGGFSDQSRVIVVPRRANSTDTIAPCSSRAYDRRR